MKKFKLKVQDAPQRVKTKKAKIPKLRVRVVEPTFRIPGTIYQGKFLPFPGYHTKPTPGYHGVFNPKDPGCRPVPIPMPNEPKSAFDDRWRRHFGMRLPDEAPWDSLGKPPLPDHQCYLNGKIVKFTTPEEYRKRDERDERIAARKAAMIEKKLANFTLDKRFHVPGKIVVKRGKITARIKTEKVERKPQKRVIVKKAAPKFFVKRPSVAPEIGSIEVMPGDTPLEVVEALEPLIKKVAAKAWETHPNNPKNKINAAVHAMADARAHKQRVADSLLRETKVKKTFNVKQLAPKPTIESARQKVIALFKMKRK